MNVLITGADGFIGKNLIASLEAIHDGKDRTHPELAIEKVLRCTRQTAEEELRASCAEADFFMFSLSASSIRR